MQILYIFVLHKEKVTTFATISAQYYNWFFYFPASPPTCASDEFFCDGECKLEFLKCDGEADCSDGTDELGCGEFSCITIRSQG